MKTRHSDEIERVVSVFLTKNGRHGIIKLARAFGKSPKTIDRWLKTGVTDPHKIYKLAVACGFEEEEALRIALKRPARVTEPAL